MALTERGDDVVVLSRGHGEDRRCGLGPRPAWFCGSGTVELVTWTAEKPGHWAAAIEGADAVVHLAGAGIMDGAWTRERRETLRSSRIRSTELLAQAIAKAERKPGVFVSGSAVGYYGTSAGDRVLAEEAPPGDDFLARLCVEWESAAAAAREAGVRVCHPRMGLALGRDGGMLVKMLPAFRAFLGGPVGTGDQYMGWVHIDDAVRSLEHALDSQLAGPFNVTAPEPVTMETFAHVLGDSLGRPAVLRVPSFAVKLAFGEDRADSLLTGQRAVPKRLVDTGFAFAYPELPSALADLVARPN